MQRKEIILHLWDTSYTIEGWYPPLDLSLRDLDYQQALWRPQGKSSHSIWQLVNHLTIYKVRFLARIQNRSFDETITTNEQTFEWGIGNSEEKWKARLLLLESTQRDIRSYIAGLEDSAFDKPCPKETIGEQLLSLIPHDSYHTGQIMYIRKLQGSWPEQRNS